MILGGNEGGLHCFDRMKFILFDNFLSFQSNFILAEYLLLIMND